MRLDRIVVLDLEATTSADRPPNAIRDVIEIGACELNPSDGSISHALSIIVRPTSSEVTEYCTALTGIDVERAEGGLPFVDALAWLTKEYAPSTSPWAGFGNFDRAQLILQCEREGLAFPLNPDYINIKLLAALRFQWVREKGLSATLKTLNLEPDGRPHSARDDAINAAKVLRRVLKDRSSACASS